MKKLQNSQPLAVSTTFRPLNTSLHIVALGGMSMQQFYRQTQGTWMPDHSKASVINAEGIQTDGALRLKAQYNINDPDDVIDFNVFRPQVYWFVDGNQVTDIEDTKDYYVADDILYVRKNYTHKQGAMVYCELRFTDTRTGIPQVISSTTSLSAVLQADESWAVNILCDRTMKHYPLNARSTIYSFEAEAKRGNEDKSASVKWFWDYSLDNGKTWKAIDTNCYWYVDGVNTRTLRIDADYIDNIMVRARISSDTSLSAPNMPNAATASLAWRWPKIVPAVFCYGGNRVFKDTQSMTFGIIVHVAKRSDMSEADKRAWLYCNWNIRKQGSADAAKSVGEYGYEATVKAIDLYSMSGVKYIVDPGVMIRGTYDAIANSSGEVLANSSGNIFCVRG